MFTSLARLTQTRSNLHLTILGASVGLLGVTLTKTSADTPTPHRRSYKYLICGGGIAAQSALHTFLENDTSDLLLVTPEWRTLPQPPSPPRTFLSSLTSLFHTAPEILIGPSVHTIDTATRVATLDDGTRIDFQRCLIAVGARMPDIPLGKVVSRDAERLVSGSHSAADWQTLGHKISANYIAGTADRDDRRAHITVVGGGWMAPVVGAELIHRGADVTFSYAEPSFLARYLPRYLAKDVYARLVHAAGGGVDTLSYSAVRYVVARETRGGVEAEVHVGSVFDAFSIIDFRTDHVVFAPTLAVDVPVDVPGAVSAGGLVANQELAVASDVYVAGGALAVGVGAVGYANGLRWGADHARETGRHAARNMLGERAVYDYVPCLTVDLGRIKLDVHVLGDLDGSAESFGYFRRGKTRGEDTCGGVFESGVLFCVKAAPARHRGAAQRLLIKGIALWDGSAECGIRDVDEAMVAARMLVSGEAMTRPELEDAMDAFATEHLDIQLFQDQEAPVGKTVRRSDVEENGEGDEAWLRPLGEWRRPSPGVVWRRHRSARAVPVRQDELLWVENEWVGAASPETKVGKMSQTYSDLLRRDGNSP